VLTLSLIALIKISLVKCSYSKPEKIMKLLVIVFSPFAVLCMITGPMMLLRDPVLSPRVLMAFGTACFFFAVLSTWPSLAQSFINHYAVFYLQSTPYTL
jgi:hypothetical protein